MQLFAERRAGSLQTIATSFKGIRVRDPAIDLSRNERTLTVVCQNAQIFVILHPVADMLHSDAGEVDWIGQRPAT